MERRHLPRLDKSAYLGFAYVHWSFTIKERKTGWLDEEFSQFFQTILLHGLARYGAACPVFCLMPDHIHLLILGWDENCQQRTLIRFLRKHTNEHLRENGFEWQKQPYDNVLQERERERLAFEKVVHYIVENPVRAGFVESPNDWEYTGCVIPGYPEVTFRSEDFLERFWRIYYSKIE